MLSTNYLFFYILSFFLIFNSILVIFLPKFSQFIIAAFLFFLSIGILYFGFNSIFLGLIQIFIFVFGILLLLLAGYNTTKTSEEKKNSFSVSKVILGLFIITLIFILVSLFTYYFHKTSYNNEMLVFSDKNNFNILTIFFINIKTVFIEYFLAYILVIIAFISVYTGINILIAKEKNRITKKESEK